MSTEPLDDAEAGIAVIGMSGAFPGAPDLDRFWENLCDGVESITFFSDEEHETPSWAPWASKWVQARGVLEDPELFDAAFFGYTPAEATAMDPQQRVFLERGWEAIEVAGYEPESYPGLIGVFGGVSSNTYTLTSLFDNPNQAGFMLTDKDFLTTRLSYRLNLRGPSVAVQTACSSSLVAVCLACQSLLSYQCDIALAGGSSIWVPLKSGYPYQLGGPVSPDGHCRPFDAEGRGFVPGHGVGVVALKRLSEALGDGDTILAVIKGSAMNNDGSGKIGYTAPSVDGQADVIAMAQELAGVDPESITYLEAHGTGTELGDPIEIAAATKVFRAGGSKKTGYCAVGSVKSNIGHLDAAAGIVSLQKVVLALQHRQIPPSLNFKRPNPKIDFANSPFFVNDRLREWEPVPGPRRAGLSSFGIGGTNVHVIVEEAPVPGRSDPARKWQLLPLSARSSQALQTASDRLASHLEGHPEGDLADTAFTLQVGRKAFAHRRFVVAERTPQAVAALREGPSEKWTSHGVEGNRKVIFMFPGQGAQYLNMGLELYHAEPGFRDSIDECSELLEPELGLDLRKVIYPETSGSDSADLANQTVLAQTAIFTVGYSLGRLWQSWGVEPAACIGHSVGEYVAACLAGVFTPQDALRLVARRAELINRMAPGAMLAIPLTEEGVRPYLSAEVSLAAVNGPSICVVSGPASRVEELQARLKSSGVPAIRLKASHAFHSPMVDRIVDDFAGCFRGLNLHPPEIPFVSNLTGSWIDKAQAADPGYWVRHLRQTVRFSDGLELLSDRDWALLEVGPGRTLSNLALSHPRAGQDRLVATSMPERRAGESEIANLLTAAGKLWLGGVGIDWEAFNRPYHRRRVPLPTYPFERQRYWALDQVGGRTSEPAAARAEQTLGRERFFAPSWRRAPSLTRSVDTQSLAGNGHIWLLMTDRAGLGARLQERLGEAGCPVVTIEAGAAYRKLSDRRYQIDPRSGLDYAELLDELKRSSLVPDVVANLWGVTPPDEDPDGEDSSGSGRDQFYSLIHLAQAFANARVTSVVRIAAVTNGAQLVLGDEAIVASKSLVRGPCLVIPQEMASLPCRHIDLELKSSASVADVNLDLLIDEMSVGPAEPVVAHRNGYRWVQAYEPVSLESEGAIAPAKLRPNGVYLITGGLGAMGLALAEWLASSTRARIALTHRSPFPPAEAWPEWLAEHSDDDLTSRRIRGLAAVERAGGEVLVLQADVSHRNEMERALEIVHQKFGPIQGAIHAAGVPGGGLVQLKTPEIAERVLTPKVEGLQTLARVLAEEPLDFMVLCSSVTAILGGFGQVDYCSANAFMDAFAWQQRRLGGPDTISINWNAWSEAGMAVETELPGNLKPLAGRFAVGDSLTNQEGVEAFGRIISGGSQPQIAISRSNLAASLAQQTKAHSLEDLTHLAAQLTSVQARPELRVSYVEPGTETETAVAKLWRECFGFEEIGIKDDFLELGGHSLLAIQLLEKVNEEMGTSLGLADLFEYKTVEALSRHIDLTLWASGPADEAEGDAWNEGREEFTL